MLNFIDNEIVSMLSLILGRDDLSSHMDDELYQSGQMTKFDYVELLLALEESYEVKVDFNHVTFDFTKWNTVHKIIQQVKLLVSVKNESEGA